MKKNKGQFIESSEICIKKLNQSICYKNSESCIHNSAIYLEDNKKLRKCNHMCIRKKLSSEVFKFTQFSTYKKTIIQFIKILEIYQFFMVQFVLANAEGGEEKEGFQKFLSQFSKHACDAWNAYNEQFKSLICAKIPQIKNECEKTYVPILVAVFLFLFVYSMICLICCKCCCKKSCCKKDENDESDKSDESEVDYNQFIMGPDGQMYSQMYEGQMMDPQLYQAGMMYPQMYQGQMYYPQMLQGGMEQPEMYYQEMEQTGTQEPRKKRKKKKKKRSSEHTNSNDDALNVGYNTM